MPKKLSFPLEISKKLCYNNVRVAKYSRYRLAIGASVSTNRRKWLSTDVFA